MESDIIRIGNLHGVRIPQPVLDECVLTDKDRVDLTVEGTRLVIARLSKPPVRGRRVGWADAFAVMAGQGDDAPLLDDGACSRWDDDAWEW